MTKKIYVCEQEYDHRIHETYCALCINQSKNREMNIFCRLHSIFICFDEVYLFTV